MLKTSLLPEATSPALAPYVLASRAEIVRVLEQLRDAGVTVTCFIDGSFLPAEAHVHSVRPAQDEVVLVAVSEMEQDMLARGGALTAVGFVEGVKVQFTAVAAGAVALPGASGVRVSLPVQLLRLQRRAHDRVKPSRVCPLECMVRGEANRPTLDRFTVLDLSAGGVALLGRARDAHTIGQRLVNVQFDLETDGELTTDLLVRNVERAEGLAGWRFGCTFVDIADTALEKVCNFVERIAAHRRDLLDNDPAR